MPKRVRALFNVALVLCFTGFSIGVSELLIRSLDRAQGPEIHPGGNHPRGLFIADSASGYILRPGFVGRMISPFGEFSVPIRIDDQGNRAAGEPVEADSTLVLGLGDSFTYGEGVEADSTYLARIERDLEERSGRPVRMMAAGVPGYSARQMLSRFRILAKEATPDFVILGLAPGSGDRLDDPFVEFAGYIVRSSFAPRLVVVGERVVEGIEAPEPLRFLDSRAKASSHLYRRLVSLGSTNRGDGTSGGDPYAKIRAARSEAWADSMRGIVREFADVCEEIHARALVLLVDATPAQEEEVVPTLKAAEVPFVRLAGPLELYHRRMGESLVFEHDDHWNERGHRVVAELVVERILAEKWIAGDEPAEAQISSPSPKSSFTSSPSRSSRT